MPNLKKIQPPARFRAELYNREVNAKLRTSRAFGTSLLSRLPVLVAAIRARMANPKSPIAYVPPVPKLAKITAPGVFRRKPKAAQRQPYGAEPEAILSTRGGRKYLRLDNGQIVKARDSILVPGALIAIIPAGQLTLGPASIKQLPSLEFPHHV